MAGGARAPALRRTFAAAVVLGPRGEVHRLCVAHVSCVLSVWRTQRATHHTLASVLPRMSPMAPRGCLCSGSCRTTAGRGCPASPACSRRQVQCTAVFRAAGPPRRAARWGAARAPQRAAQRAARARAARRRAPAATTWRARRQTHLGIARRHLPSCARRCPRCRAKHRAAVRAARAPPTRASEAGARTCAWRQRSFSGVARAHLRVLRCLRRGRRLLLLRGAVLAQHDCHGRLVGVIGQEVVILTKQARQGRQVVVRNRASSAARSAL